MAVRVPIVEAKLVPPAIPELMVPRPRLLARLAEALKKPLVLVVAEAGYGKTTLLRQVIAVLPVKTVWYTLDKRDEDVALFLHYLIRGIRAHFPGFGRSIEAALLRRSGEATSDLLPAIVASELGRTVTGELFLILDDFHEVQRSRGLRDLLAYLLDHLPPAVHVVVLSRVKPPFPLARWRTAGRVAELTTEELRFTLEEVQALCDQFSGGLLGDEVRDTLHAKTEGWAAGLALALESLRGKSPEEARNQVRRISGTTRFIYEYLTQEVYERLEPELKDFLLQTAILPYLDADFCDRFLVISRSREILSSLEERHVFLSALPSPEQSRPGGSHLFRYHPLFRDFLLARFVKERGAEALRELHTRAAQLLREQGEEVLAIDHFLAAGQVEEAVDLIKRMSEPLLARGHRDLVTSWLDRLPPEDLSEDAHLLYLSGLAAQYQGKWDEAGIAYRKALEMCGEGQDVLAAKVHYELGMLAATRRSYGEARMQYEQALQAVEGKQESSMLARIYNGLGIVCANTAMQEEAKEHYTRALAAAEQAGDLGMVARIFNNLGVTLAIQTGDISLQEAYVHRGLELARRAEDLYVQTILTNNLAYIGAIRGDYPRALPLFAQVIALADRCGAMDIKAIALARRGWVQFGSGRKQEGWQDLTESLDLCRRGLASEPDSLIFLSLGYLPWEEYEEILRWLKRGLESVEGEGYPQDTIAGCHAGLGRVYLRLGLLGEARTHLELGLGLLENSSYWMRPFLQLDLAETALREGNMERAKELWEATRILGMIREIRPALAEAHRLEGLIATREGRWDVAIEAFQRCCEGWRGTGRVLDLARTMGELATVWFEREGRGSRMGQNLLLEALRTCEELGAARVHANLLALAGRYGVEVKGPAPRKGRLTEREREILRLVAQGLTNKEIAFQLRCSVRTVDSHIRNILDRLEVSSRSQAVAVAIQEGLL